PLAKYWKAYYLTRGYAGVGIDLKEAQKLFKEAADDDIGEAQYFYAKLIKKDANNDSTIAEECVEYFEMAAMNGIPAAMFELGKIYYYGKYNVEIDKDRAKSYHKEAKKNGIANAKNELEKISKLENSV
ncbi:8872_t:CDS:1, partial [Entrophospora sp. SA101]